MAGRKQHFIPKHFLKEFVIPDGSDKHWMYRRGLPNPVPVSRSDAAAIRDFYSNPTATGAPTLDDMITDYENKLKFRVEKARAIPVGETLPAHLISEVVAHLTIRAAYLRELVDVGASELVSSIDTLIHRPIEFLESLELPKHRPPEKFEALAIEQFEKHLLSSLINVTPRAITRLIYQFAREEYDRLQRAVSQEFKDFVERFQGELRNMPQRVHVQVLEKELVPASRQAMLEGLQWRVVDFPSGDAVLPDCIAIAEDARGWGPYILADPQSIARVVIPLSSAKLAVGSLKEDWEDVSRAYNQRARESCFTFFLKNRRDEEVEGLFTELGGPARDKIADVISSALREAVDEFLVVSSDVSPEERQPVCWADLSAMADFSCSIYFKDFGDEALAKKVAVSLNDAIRKFGSQFPIHRLDGITFAIDYAAALRELDRGQGIACLIDSSAGNSTNGVAMPLAVQREDGIKTHIVLRSYLAEQLISKDETLKEEAFMVVFYCLGTTAFNTLIEGKFPGTILASLADLYEGWLYQYNDTLLATYFSTCLLATNKEAMEFYCEQTLLQLDQMISVTTDAQIQYQDAGDHERFFKICATHVSGFMTAMTRYFAARSTIIGPHRPDGPLDRTLEQLELLKWSKLFEDDLAEFNRRLDDWSSLDEINFLNRHFERLLLEVGVLPDQMNDGSLYVHTFSEHRLATRARS